MTTKMMKLLMIPAFLGFVACGGELDGGAEAADLAEVEAEARATVCGGIMAWRCADGYVCADDPRDECYPDAGDEGCTYTCQRAPRR